DRAGSRPLPDRGPGRGVERVEGRAAMGEDGALRVRPQLPPPALVTGDGPQRGTVGLPHGEQVGERADDGRGALHVHPSATGDRRSVRVEVVRPDRLQLGRAVRGDALLGRGCTPTTRMRGTAAASRTPPPWRAAPPPGPPSWRAPAAPACPPHTLVAIGGR